MVRLSILFIVLSIAGCAGKKDDNIVFLQEVNKSLEQSNQSIRMTSQLNYCYLENKKMEPMIADRAIKWSSKAKAILYLSDSMSKHINDLEKSLINEAGFDPFIDQNKPSGNDIVAHVFYEHKEGQLLHEKLALYKRNVLAVDDSIARDFTSQLQIIGSDQITTTDAFIKKYFNGSLAEAIVMLNKIENEIRITEDKLIDFCENTTHVLTHEFVYHSPMVIQSTTIAAPGEKITIDAGIGSFSPEAKPTITIDGKKVSGGDEGHVSFEIDAGKPGEHAVRVVINYYDQSGVQKEYTRMVKYTVKPN
jgi:hypothetical protein